MGIRRQGKDADGEKFSGHSVNGPEQVLEKCPPAERVEEEEENIQGRHG